MSDEWRMLGPEEVIQEGDEIWLFSTKKWGAVKSFCTIGNPTRLYPRYKFRRRVSTPATDKESLEVQVCPKCMFQKGHSKACLVPALEAMKQRAEKAEAERDLKDELLATCVKNLQAQENAHHELQQAEKERDQLREQLKIAEEIHSGAVKEFDRLQAENDQLRADLKTLADRFNCPVEHAVTVALTFATTTDGVLNGLRAENERLAKELSEAQAEWESILAGEKLGGNIVKEAEARGVLIGLRFAQQALAKGDFSTHNLQAAESELKQLRKFGEYVQHKAECELELANQFSWYKCTCGLEQLQQEAKAAYAAKGERTERCGVCGNQTSDWVDVDWRGRICRGCESKGETK